MEERLEKAYNKISINLLDTNISPEKLIIFTKIMSEEAEEMANRIMSKLEAAAFTTKEIVFLMDNVVGTVAENPELFKE